MLDQRHGAVGARRLHGDNPIGDIRRDDVAASCVLDTPYNTPTSSTTFGRRFCSMLCTQFSLIGLPKLLPWYVFCSLDLGPLHLFFLTWEENM